MELVDGAKNTLKKLQLMTGGSLKETKIFLKYFFIIIIMDFLEDKSTQVPYFGEIKINHINDVIKKEGKEAVIDLIFKADPQLLRSIGQIVDNEESDIEKFLYDNIEEELNKMIGE